MRIIIHPDKKNKKELIFVSKLLIKLYIVLRENLINEKKLKLKKLKPNRIK